MEPLEIENGNVTGNVCQNLRIRKLFTRLQSSRSDFFQLGFTAPHRSTRIRSYVSLKCYNYWIGWQGPVSWLVRSLDLTLCHFFQLVYLIKVVRLSCTRYGRTTKEDQFQSHRIRSEILAK